eukprot:g10980.t1
MKGSGKYDAEYYAHHLAAQMKQKGAALMKGQHERLLNKQATEMTNFVERQGLVTAPEVTNLTETGRNIKGKAGEQQARFEVAGAGKKGARGETYHELKMKLQDPAQRLNAQQRMSIISLHSEASGCPGGIGITPAPSRDGSNIYYDINSYDHEHKTSAVVTANPMGPPRSGKCSPPGGAEGGKAGGKNNTIAAAARLAEIDNYLLLKSTSAEEAVYLANTGKAGTEDLDAGRCAHMMAGSSHVLANSIAAPHHQEITANAAHVDIHRDQMTHDHGHGGVERQHQGISMIGADEAAGRNVFSGAAPPITFCSGERTAGDSMKLEEQSVSAREAQVHHGVASSAAAATHGNNDSAPAVAVVQHVAVVGSRAGGELVLQQVGAGGTNKQQGGWGVSLDGQVEQPASKVSRAPPPSGSGSAAGVLHHQEEKEVVEQQHQSTSYMGREDESKKKTPIASASYPPATNHDDSSSWGPEQGDWEQYMHSLHPDPMDPCWFGEQSQEKELLAEAYYHDMMRRPVPPLPQMKNYKTSSKNVDDIPHLRRAGAETSSSPVRQRQLFGRATTGRKVRTDDHEDDYRVTLLNALNEAKQRAQAEEQGGAQVDHAHAGTPLIQLAQHPAEQNYKNKASPEEKRFCGS